MNYFDILEKLDMSILNDKKIDKFYVNIYNIIPAYENNSIPPKEAFEICQQIGIAFDVVVRTTQMPVNTKSFLLGILYPHGRYNNGNLDDFREFIGKLSVILQAQFFQKNDKLKQLTKNALNDCNLPFELCDNIIIPKGAKELDEAVVCSVAEWLQKYPTAQQPYTTALQNYFNSKEPCDIADNLRKSFEAFLREFLKSESNLDENIKKLGLYLKKHNISIEVRNMFTMFISYYKTHNDKTAKHRNDTDKNSIEFLLYQTGVFMRYLLTIQQSEVEENHAN